MLENIFSKIAVEQGLSIGIFALCVWLVVKIVTQLCGAMEKLVSKLDVFMNRVKDEHEQSQKHHESLMRQHEAMIETLGRINGYKRE